MGWVIRKLWVVWLCGVIASLVAKLVDYRGFLRYLRLQNKEEEDAEVQAVLDDVMMDLHIKKDVKLYRNSLVSSPMLVGMFHPYIVLPAELPVDGALSALLTHELVHYKRKDIWVKWLVQAARCVHWFNPVLAVASRDISRSCEMACDEAVNRFLDTESRKRYGNMLLDIAAGELGYQDRILPLTLVENKKYIKERLDTIMNEKKKTGLTVLCSVLVLCFLLTSAVVVGASTAGAVLGSRKDTEAVGRDLAGRIRLLAEREARLGSVADGLGDSAVLEMGKMAGNTPITLSSKDGGGLALAGMMEEDGSSYYSSPDKKDQKAAAIYGSKDKIRGESYCSRSIYYNVKMTRDIGSEMLQAKRFVFNGSNTLFIVDVKKDVTMDFSYSVDKLKEGKFKICLITPDNKVTTLMSGAGSYDSGIALKKGRNCVKMVGAYSELEGFKLQFDGPGDSEMNGWYWSEEQEKFTKIYEELMKSGDYDVDTILEIAPCLEEKDVSKLLIALLEKGITLEDDQLAELYVFADEDIMGEYLLGKLGSGIAPEPKLMKKIVAFLSEEYISKYISYMTEKGALEEDDIYSFLPFMEEDSLSQFLSGWMKKNPEGYDMLAAVAPFMDEEDLAGSVAASIKLAPKKGIDILKGVATFMDEEDLAECVWLIVQSNTRVTLAELQELAYFMDDEDVIDLLDAIVSKGWVSKKKAASYKVFWFGY